MKLFLKLTFLSFAAFYLYSCCPSYRVYLINNSAKPKKIQVIVTDRKWYGWECSNYMTDELVQTAAITEDPQNASFSFVLDTAQRALIQERIGVVDQSENIIIDNADTLYLRDIRKFFKEKRMTRHTRGFNLFDFTLKINR